MFWVDWTEGGEKWGGGGCYEHGNEISSSIKYGKSMRLGTIILTKESALRNY